MLWFEEFCLFIISPGFCKGIYTPWFFLHVMLYLQHPVYIIVILCHRPTECTAQLWAERKRMHSPLLISHTKNLETVQVKAFLLLLPSKYLPTSIFLATLITFPLHAERQFPFCMNYPMHFQHGKTGFNVLQSSTRAFLLPILSYQGKVSDKHI